MPSTGTGDAEYAGSTVRPYSADGALDAGAVSGVAPIYGLERPLYLLGPGVWAGRRGSRFHIRSG